MGGERVSGEVQAGGSEQLVDIPGDSALCPGRTSRAGHSRCTGWAAEPQEGDVCEWLSPHLKRSHIKLSFFVSFPHLCRGLGDRVSRGHLEEGLSEPPL